MERVRRNIYSFLTVLFVGVVMITGSIVVFRTTFPGDLSLSEDGFYEIYTAYDYERFWRRVESQDFINGRLMADIRLADLADSDGEKRQTSLAGRREVESFRGEFDGNGHSIHGLYSENGYGLVEKNRGRIYALTLTHSLILGGNAVGGICLENYGQITDCTFAGELKSREREILSDGRMAGICAENEGVIAGCAYRGTMTVHAIWLESGVRAGICGENRGQIEDCSNFTGLGYYSGQGNRYAIADAGVKNSFVRQGSGWNMPESGREQVMELDREQVRLFPFFREKEIYEWYAEEAVLPECVRQAQAIWKGLVEKESGKSTGRKEAEGAGGPGENDFPVGTGDLWQPGRLWQEEQTTDKLLSGNIRMEDNQILNRKMLADEWISELVRLAFFCKGEDWRRLRLDTSDDGIAISDGEELVRIRVFEPDRDSSRDISNMRNMSPAREIWEICQEANPEQELCVHHTWELLKEEPHAVSFGSDWRGAVAASGRTADVTADASVSVWEQEDLQEGEFLILYLTQEGGCGFFLASEGMLCQVENEDSLKESEVEALAHRIAQIPVVRLNGEEEGKTRGLWEGLLFGLWDDRLPGDGFRWKEEDIRQAVYRSAGAWGGEVPSHERILALEELRISYPDQLETLEDLRKLPHLGKLELTAEGNVRFDLSGDMVPELHSLSLEGVSLTDGDSLEALKSLSGLTSLAISCCEVRDLSFLEGMPELWELFLEKNQIRDFTFPEGLEELASVVLRGNRVKDIGPLAHLEELRELDLSGNQVKDISPLENLKGLKSLILSDNPVSDITPLSGLTGLERLRADRMQIEDISPLRELSQLNELSLSDNRIWDIGPLAGLTDMEALWLDGNLLEDYSALEQMEKLYVLSITGNPGQNIGKRVFTPLIYGGNYGGTEKAALIRAQEYLEQYWPERALWARDVAFGDLNGDGLRDMVILGLEETEEDYMTGYGWPFLGQENGGFQKLPPVDLGGYYGEYVYETYWRGMLIAEGMLVTFQEGYDCDAPWGRRQTYFLEAGELKAGWQVSIDQHYDGEEAGFTLMTYYGRKGIYRAYVVARDERGRREILLISEEDASRETEREKSRERLEEGLAELESKAGYALPTVYDASLKPMAATPWGSEYLYEIRSIPAKIKPERATEIVAEALLADAMALPIPEFALAGIKDSYDRLLGVEVPEHFYMGWVGNDLNMLTWQYCEEKEEVGICHVFDLRMCNEDRTNWIWVGQVRFDEDTEEITME